MPISLPNPGQSPWATQLNTALSTIDGQTVVTGAVVGDNLVLTRNNGTQVTAGNVRGPAGTGGGLTAEEVRDIVGQLLSAGSGVNIAVNDTEDSIVISATGGGGTGNLSGVGLTEIRTMSSQAEYDALGTKNPTTLYIVPGSGTTIPDPDPDPGTPTTHKWRSLFSTDGALVNFDTGQPFVTAGSPVASGGVVPVTADGQYILANTGGTEQTVTVRVKGDVNTTTFPTIILRGTGADNNNQYRVQRDANSVVKLNRRVSNAQTAVHSFDTNSFPNGSGLDFEFKASVRNVGSTCEFFFWINGVPLQSAPIVDSSATRPAGTYAGLRGAMTTGGNVYSWDDLRIDDFCAVPA